MPLYIGDYLADTMHLTTEQHGAYLLLIMAYWKNGGPLPGGDARLAAICRMSTDAWSIAQAMLRPFFSINSDGDWTHSRIDLEMANAGKNKAKRTERAQKAAKARWGDAPSNAPSMLQASNKHAPSNAKAMLEECPSPSPSHSKDLDQKPRAKAKKQAFEPPGWVPLDSWSAYLEMRQKRKSPNTDNAMDLAVKKLAKLEAEGHPPRDVLDQSTLNGWAGLFPIRGDSNHGNASERPGAESMVDTIKRKMLARERLLDLEEQRDGSDPGAPADEPGPVYEGSYFRS